MRGLTREVSPLLRVATALVVAGMAISVGSLWTRSVRLERELSGERTRLDTVAELLQRTQGERGNGEALSERLRETAGRVTKLERRATARERIIVRAAPAVLFVQGAFGFTDAASGRPLRFAVSPEKKGGRGSRIGVTLEGDGPPVEVEYTGTGFLAGDGGFLLTNRHIALPWEFDETARAVGERGFRAEMRRLVGYLPGAADPVPLHFVTASDSADLALLRSEPLVGRPGLALTTRAPRIGDEVIVLGYPTGIRALLARAEPELVAELLAGGEPDFWDLAAELSRRGYIAPLATAGVVGQITASRLVYDAQTTHGGSGGPVLDLEGRVVAINAAIVPEFGGSNLGVPASEAEDLLLHAMAGQEAHSAR